MAKLEDLTRSAFVKGILPDCLVTVIDVKWYGSAAIELTYKDPTGKPSVVLLYRDREPTLEVVEAGRPWSFYGDGKLFRLVSEAHPLTVVANVVRKSTSTGPHPFPAHLLPCSGIYGRLSGELGRDLDECFRDKNRNWV